MKGNNYMAFFEDEEYNFLKRSNQILEKTKKHSNKYSKERHILFNYTMDPNPNYEEWKHFLESFEETLRKESK